MPADVSRRVLSLALSLTPGIGGKTLTRILARNDLLGRLPDEFLRLGSETLQEEYRLRTKVADCWTAGSKSLIERARLQESRLQKMGIQFVTAADDQYPRILEEFDPDPPGVLYIYGNIRLIQAKTFSVMSSRNAPPAALDAIETLVEKGAVNGEALVSGHNTPEYQRASIVPLRWGVPRILVLDRELFDALGDDLKSEPFRAARLWRHQFDAVTDVAITAVPPDVHAHPAANRQRDRIIAGLAKRIDFTWINPEGNMEKIARMAAKAGRPVRILDLFPGTRDWSRYGAQILELSDLY